MHSKNGFRTTPLGVQFLGYCVKMINKESPWVHIVKGKLQKPTTQGSLEVSHKAFKNALVKWLDKEKRENPLDPKAEKIG
jgi:hypothetical protein